jgi:hypothetical protein
MLRRKTKSMLRRRGAAGAKRGPQKTDPRSPLRSQAASHRYFWLRCASAWRLVEFTERLEMLS